MQVKEYSKQWLNFKEAEENFYKSKMDFISSDFDKQISDFELALSSNRNEALLALSILENLEAKHVALIKLLVEVAIDGNEIVASDARKVVLKYRDIAKDQIISCINEFLKDSKEDYFNYSNIAQLLYKLEYKDELLSFLNSYCKESQGNDIQELWEDYSNE